MKLILFNLVFASALTVRAAPHDQLKALYDGSSTAATRKDFDSFGVKSSMQCAGASSGSDEAEMIGTFKWYALLKPSRGPLFPSSQRDLLVPEAFDKASVKYDGSEETSLRDFAEGLTLGSTATDLTMSGQQLLLSGWKTVKYSFRKKGSYIIEKSEVGNDVSYIYCWK